MCAQEYQSADARATKNARGGRCARGARSAAQRPEPGGTGGEPLRSARAPMRAWTVSRVLFPTRVAPRRAKAIHLGDALPRRSSALTRMPGRRLAATAFGRAALDGIPIRACSGRGLPRRQSPGRRAWALTPRFHPCLCLPRRPHQAAASSAIGGVISVALSLGSPRVAVSDLPALWSPDFPPADGACPPATFRPPPARAA